MSGGVKRHPDWPRVKAVALHRPQFTDDPATPASSWLMVQVSGVGGIRDVTAEYVADWPDADGDWPTEEPES